MQGGRLGGGAAVPEETVVARVYPFDPAYSAFVDLCREYGGNRWLPRIELVADLEGAGSVVFLEFVTPMRSAGNPRWGGAGKTWTTPTSSEPPAGSLGEACI